MIIRYTMPANEGCVASYSWAVNLRPPASSVFGSLYLSLSVIAPVMNSLLIMSFIASKQLASATNKLIVCLSVADFLNGIVSFPLMLCIHFGYINKENCTLMVGTIVIIAACTYTSSYIILLLAIERYTQMNSRQSSRRSSKVFRSPTIYVVVSVIAAFSFGQSTSYVFLERSGGPGCIAARVISMLTPLIGFPVIAFVYIRGYRNVRRCVAAAVNDADIPAIPCGTVNSRQNFVRRLQRIVYMLVMSLLATYGLHMIANCIDVVSFISSSNERSQSLVLVLNLSVVVLHTHGTINCFIILHLNHVAKDWIVNKVHAICHG